VLSYNIATEITLVFRGNHIATDHIGIREGAAGWAHRRKRAASWRRLDAAHRRGATLTMDERWLDGGSAGAGHRPDGGGVGARHSGRPSRAGHGLSQTEHGRCGWCGGWWRSPAGTAAGGGARQMARWRAWQSARGPAWRRAACDGSAR
jgi:hypothetical protein